MLIKKTLVLLLFLNLCVTTYAQDTDSVTIYTIKIRKAKITDVDTSVRGIKFDELPTTIPPSFGKKRNAFQKYMTKKNFALEDCNLYCLAQVRIDTSGMIDSVVIATKLSDPCFEEIEHFIKDMPLGILEFIMEHLCLCGLNCIYIGQRKVIIRLSFTAIPTVGMTRIICSRKINEEEGDELRYYNKIAA